MQLKDIIGIYSFIETLGYGGMFILIITILLFSSLWIKKSVIEIGITSNNQNRLVAINLLIMLLLLIGLKVKSDSEKQKRATASTIKNIYYG